MKKRIFTKKSLQSLAKEAGITTKTLWAIILGGSTGSPRVARVLAEHSGASPQDFMFIEKQQGRFRYGFLAWIAASVGLSLVHTWRIFMWGRPVRATTAERLAKFTGVQAGKWTKIGIKGNWMIEMSKPAQTI